MNKMSPSIKSVTRRLKDKLDRQRSDSKKPDSEKIQTDSSELTSEERSLLSLFINKGIRGIRATIGSKGVIYEGLEDVAKEYGVKELNQILESLSMKGYLRTKKHDPTLFCPKCDAIHVLTKYNCPKCQSTDVGITELIEHPLCGYTGLKKSFISGMALICPNCGTNLGSIFQDRRIKDHKLEYRVIGFGFQCENCGNKFDRPSFSHICQQCGYTFDYKRAEYKKLQDYEINEDAIRDIGRKDKYSILLVEDNADDAEIITKYLSKSIEFIEIEKAISGSEGLNKIQQKRFDIIILDYMLSDTDGLKLLEKIKSRNMNAFVVMLTGVDDRKTAVEAMKLGASDYIVKSLDSYKELPTRIKNLIQDNPSILSARSKRGKSKENREKQIDIMPIDDAFNIDEIKPEVKKEKRKSRKKGKK